MRANLKANRVRWPWGLRHRVIASVRCVGPVSALDRSLDLSVQRSIRALKKRQTLRLSYKPAGYHPDSIPEPLRSVVFSGFWLQLTSTRIYAQWPVPDRTWRRSHERTRNPRSAPAGADEQE